MKRTIDAVFFGFIGGCFEMREPGISKF